MIKCALHFSNKRMKKKTKQNKTKQNNTKKQKTTNLFTISKTIGIYILSTIKNLKYRCVTIKVHLTISKLNKRRLKIALKSTQVMNIAKLTL